MGMVLSLQCSIPSLELRSCPTCLLGGEESSVIHMFWEIYPRKICTCFLESRDCSGCGHFSGVSAPISLLECQDDVSSYLKYYHLSSKILEYELILFRSGHFGLEMGKLKQMFVCSKHRNALGKHWKCGKSTCQHPEHKGKWERKETKCWTPDWLEMFSKFTELQLQSDHVSNIF